MARELIRLKPNRKFIGIIKNWLRSKNCIDHVKFIEAFTAIGAMMRKSQKLPKLNLFDDKTCEICSKIQMRPYVKLSVNFIMLLK